MECDAAGGGDGDLVGGAFDEALECRLAGYGRARALRLDRLVTAQVAVGRTERVGRRSGSGATATRNSIAILRRAARSTAFSICAYMLDRRVGTDRRRHADMEYAAAHFD